VDAIASELRQTVEALSALSTDEAGSRDEKSASKETDLMLGKILLRVDELTRRLDELEESGVTAATPDLGALEHRVEQAETAGRENRESVLVQLERLAARVEYRLDRLEAEQPTAAAVSPPGNEGTGARVVPLRGNEA
jgi:hypothetical protein